MDERVTRPLNPPMHDSFGARLRHHREQHGIALDAIARQSKIKLSLLEGLERDDLSHWPSGIFRRAYVRAYAAAIGLEPDATAREFLARYPEPEEHHLPSPPPKGLRAIVGTAFGSLARRKPESPA